ncbi:MAG: hypothetical protein M3268_05715, partial [Acidobacteriota bacterium]|nr:hypothetical protein [Acidobacteriota bacterium]
ILHTAPSLEAACAEMKRRCFERGAEDNLTAVAVRVGARAGQTSTAADADDEVTLVSERTGPQPAAASDAARGGADTANYSEAATAGAAAGAGATVSRLTRPFDSANANSATNTLNTSNAAGVSSGAGRSRISGEVRDPDPAPASSAVAPVAREPGPTGRASRWLMTLLLLIVVGAAAFYGGLRFQQSRDAQAASTAAATQKPAPATVDPTYDSLRRQVDAAPTAEAGRMANEASGKSLGDNDAQFLSLYGRALLLSGKYQDALGALRLADQKLGTGPNAHDALSVDTRLALAAAAVRANDETAVRDAARSLSTVIEGGPVDSATGAPPNAGANSSNGGVASPSATPFR